MRPGFFFASGFIVPDCDRACGSLDPARPGELLPCGSLLPAVGGAVGGDVGLAGLVPGAGIGPIDGLTCATLTCAIRLPPSMTDAITAKRTVRRVARIVVLIP